MAAFAAFFQGLLYLLGWLAGSALANYFGELSFPVAVVILLFIGIRMFADARKKGAGHRTYTSKDHRILAAFSLAMGINAFLLSISLGLIQASLLYQVTALIVIVFLAVVAGVKIGRRNGTGTAKKIETAGSALIVLLALSMVLRYFNLF